MFVCNGTVGLYVTFQHWHRLRERFTKKKIEAATSGCLSNPFNLYGQTDPQIKLDLPKIHKKL